MLVLLVGDRAGVPSVGGWLWSSGDRHWCAQGRIQKKPSTSTDQESSTHSSQHMDYDNSASQDDQGPKFQNVSVWDHASFCGGVCRSYNRTLVCQECGLPSRGGILPDDMDMVGRIQHNCIDIPEHQISIVLSFTYVHIRSCG